MPTAAPAGDLTTFERGTFASDGASHDMYHKGSGPAVIVITEMPGLSPMVLGFADRIAAAGCSVVLPDLYGTAGRAPFAGSTLSVATYAMRSMVSGCVSRDFSTFALDRTSPIATWLRALARAQHERCGGPGVGVVGMCFSGGFALAMATDPSTRRDDPIVGDALRSAVPLFVPAIPFGLVLGVAITESAMPAAIAICPV